jgi:hypothetical protein
MKYLRYIIPATFLFSACFFSSCNKTLEKNVYSAVPAQNFWQTPEQVAAGVAPAYQALTQIPDDAVHDLNEITGGEIIAPTRGSDWDDNGEWKALWEHTWKPGLGILNDAWSEIFVGISQCNFVLSVLDSLQQKPANIANIDAELKVLRAYFYFLIMDMYGNVPLVTDYNTDPNTITNSSRKDVFKFLEQELKENVPLLTPNKDAGTYGRLTKWAGYMLLAKLYLNAEVYTGQQRCADCMSACDSVINSGKYSLEDYFANFAIDNEGSTENIFVVPFDKVNISGNYSELETLPYQLADKYGLNGTPWNGFCSTFDYYSQFDDADNRKKMFLIGQQYDNSGNKIIDQQTGLPLKISPYVNEFSSAADTFRFAGVRNIKYTPEPGTGYQAPDGSYIQGQSNDMVLFRYADALLMKAEAETRLKTNTGDALHLVNQVRERAYGNADHDWKSQDLTLPNLLAERQREFAWEFWGRNDAIRFGTFGDARVPEKKKDKDAHLELFPIPAPQISSNPNLKQNSGY